MWILLLGLGICLSVRMPVMESYIVDHTTTKNRSTILDIYYFTAMKSGGVLTPVMGYLNDRFGFYLSFTIAGAALFLATLVCSFFLREDALNFILKTFFTPDVVVPKMSGREVYEEMKKIKTSVSSLFVTGYSLNGIHTNFILQQGIEALQKPYSFEAIAINIREILDKKIGSTPILLFDLFLKGFLLEGLRFFP